MLKTTSTLVFGAAMLVGAIVHSTPSFADDPIEAAEEGKMAAGAQKSAPPERDPIEVAEEGKMAPGAQKSAPPKPDPIEEAEQSQ